VSEPTYRIELTNHPEDGAAVCWRAAVYSVADYDENSTYNPAIFDAFRATREDAMDAAQAWCKAKASEPQEPSTVFLNEDGELHQPLRIA
jgi:hypothetical protein